MPGLLTTFEKDICSAEGNQTSNRVRAAATVLAGIAIVSSAFHFWPFEDSKAWQMLCPANLAVLVWVLFLAGYSLPKHRRGMGSSLLPHLSVLAYLSINILSMAFAHDLSRAGNYTIKLTLMLVGGYILLSSAVYTARTLRIVYGLTTAAVLISVFYCLAARFGFGSEAFGFHRNVYKYGTYIGILTPLCGAYLFTSSRVWSRLLGAVLVIGALVSSGSLGAVAAILVGMAVPVIAFPRWSIKFCIKAALLLGVVFVVWLNSNSATGFLLDDTKLAEKDGVNLKQRYIEWQAEVNLLEERSITGTGAGCINEYRSSFYYRLPKLNTLKAFDQNGWLATGAETGILGLVCFCWIILYYGKLAFSEIRKARQAISTTACRFATANLAGLTGACVANLFSSVHYNGILIVFVLVIALISTTRLLFAVERNANDEIR